MTGVMGRLRVDDLTPERRTGPRESDIFPRLTGFAGAGEPRRKSRREVHLR
jgi:hypothetical protein